MDKINQIKGGKIKGRSVMSFNKHTNKFTFSDLGIAYVGIEATNDDNLKKAVPNFDRMEYASALRPDPNIPANIQPNAETTLFVPFRLVSATMVGAGTWKATDFTNEQVLRDSMPLLLGKPIYSGHWAYEQNWLGRVAQVAWTPAFAQGIENVPSGIDAILEIDTSTQRGQDIGKGIVRNVLVSNSVSVEFEWEFSHEITSDDDLYDMFWKVGEMDADGKMYCRVVTKIVNYSETSIVTDGADPYAKKIDENGNLIMIDKAGAEQSKAAVEAMDAEARVSFAKELVSKYEQVVTNEANKPMLLSLSKRFAQKFDDPNIEEAVVVQQPEEQVEIAKGALATLVDNRIAFLIENKNYGSKTEVIEALADAVGCTPRTIRNYISGTTKCPSKEALVAMSGVLLVAQADCVMAAESDGCSYGTIDTVPVVLPSVELAKETASQEPFVLSDDKKEGEMCDDEKMCDDEEDDEMAKLKAENAALKQDIKDLNAEIEKKSNEYKGLKNLHKTDKEANAALQQSFNAIKEQFEKQKAIADFGNEQLVELRNEAVKRYNAAFGDKAQPSMIALLQNSNDPTFIKETIASFGSKVGSQFSFICKSCGSDKVEFDGVKQVDADAMDKGAVVAMPDKFPTKSFERTRQ